MIFYKQVLLQWNGWETVAWIPEAHAHKGKLLKLRESDGWRVVEVFGPRLPAVYGEAYWRDWKHQREASDI